MSSNLIPAPQLRQYGLYRFDIEKAAEGNLEDALKFGSNLGLTGPAVYKDVKRTRLRARNAYRSGSTGVPGEKVGPLIKAVKQCLPGPATANND
ncbi:hypothetical protein [Sphingomonas sp. F9_3S_D5_B_2]